MVFNCKICGGALEIDKLQRIVTCPYCGVQQTLPNTEDEKIANLYDRANHFLKNNDYDKAQAIYESILDIDSTDNEAYWSIVLCKYGIEYVKDTKTGEYKPTCNRTQTKSIFSDDDYKKALENGTEEQQVLYRKQAEEINEIQKKILEISRKEPPYDVFICYKEKDKNGERTIDSVLAQDIYDKLVSEKFKVFFARITLEDKLGTEYEPYIYSALNSSKVMIVICTSKEHFFAPWVRNEWSRYLNLIKQDKEKILIPCFKDMDAYDLPEEFAHIQAQDMNKIGFMQDLVRGIKKVIVTGDGDEVKKKSALTTSEKEEIYNNAVKDIETIQNSKKIGYKNKINTYKKIENNLRQLGNYKDAGILASEYEELIKKEIKKHKNKLIRNSIIIVLIVGATIIATKKLYIEPKIAYDLAIEQYNNKDYYNSIQSFSKLNTYADSNKKIDEAKSMWRKSNTNIMCTPRYGDVYGELLAVKQIGSVTKIGGSNVSQVAWPIVLKDDGTVELINDNYMQENKDNYTKLEDNIKLWKDIVSICASEDYVLGVTSDGKVKTARYDFEGITSNMDLSDWTNIIQVEPCLSGGVVGLKEDGTVVYKGVDKSCILPLKEWKNVVQLSGTYNFLVALKNDGTTDIVYATYGSSFQLEEEKDVIQLSKNDYWSNKVSLIKSDGKVKTYENSISSECNTDAWQNIVFVYTNAEAVYGVTKSGSIMKVGGKSYDNALYWTGIKINEEWRTVKKVEDKSKEIDIEKTSSLKERAQASEDVIIGNGTSTVTYRGYIYSHIYNEENSNYEVIKTSTKTKETTTIISYKNDEGWFYPEIWINGENIYLQIGAKLKRYDFNGENEKNIVEGTASTPIKVDLKNEIAVAYNENILKIVKLDGTNIKDIKTNFEGDLYTISSDDKENIFFTSKISEESTNYNTYNSLVSLYMLNKNNYEFTKVTTETLNEGWYGCGIYQAELNKDYVYYIAGSQEGTGGYFNGSLYKVKKDGTDKEKVDIEEFESNGFSENQVPTFTIKNNYLYYSGLSINLETGEKLKDNFENGDVIDDDNYIYTASLSTQSKIVLTKYKARTDMEDLTTLFTKEIPNGSYVDTQKIQIKVERDYVYITISYKDLDDETGIKAWQGVVYDMETYRMKKDGRDLKQITE